MDRPYKGKSVIALPSDYVVIDTETTGLDYEYCDLIEVSAIRYRGDAVVDRFTSLVKPPRRWTYLPNRDGETSSWEYVDAFITDLTGITNEMLDAAPEPEDVLGPFLAFLGDDLLIGHNVHFDVNFIYDAVARHLGKNLTLDFIDTMRIAHKAFPDLPHYRLSDVAAACGVEPDRAHRALADCETTAACYQTMKRDILSKMTEDAFSALYQKRPISYNKFIEELKAGTASVAADSPIFGQTVCFTGTLERMTRKEALTLVASLGGNPTDTLTKSTNYLVIGSAEYLNAVKKGKTSKMKKAEAYALKGADIQVISENTFFSMLEQ